MDLGVKNDKSSNQKSYLMQFVPSVRWDYILLVFFAFFPTPEFNEAENKVWKVLGFFWGGGGMWGRYKVCYSDKNATLFSTCVPFLLGVHFFLELFSHLFTWKSLNVLQVNYEVIRC